MIGNREPTPANRLFDTQSQPNRRTSHKRTSPARERDGLSLDSLYRVGNILETTREGRDVLGLVKSEIRDFDTRAAGDKARLKTRVAAGKHGEKREKHVGISEQQGPDERFAIAGQLDGRKPLPYHRQREIRCPPCGKSSTSRRLGCLREAQVAVSDSEPGNPPAMPACTRNETVLESY